jgi:hypothetical protein
MPQNLRAFDTRLEIVDSLLFALFVFEGDRAGRDVDGLELVVLALELAHDGHEEQSETSGQAA